jgi:hypothetical protein
MTKIIEAKAVISAADKTGNVFDAIANKLKGVEKSAKAFEGIKAPKFSGDMMEELHRLQLTEKELQGVRKSYAAFDNQLKAMQPRVSHYMRAHEEFAGATVDRWREIKAATQEADEAHKKFFKGAGHFARHTAGHLVGGIGAAYIGAHAIKKVAEAAGERNREGIREEIAGFTPEQQADANKVADQVSMRHPSLSRTDVLEDLRKNTARLGSLDRAKEIAEAYAKARIFNQLNGGDEKELEQVVRAAEGAGAANTGDQLKSFINGFAKARARNPDYTGEEFAADFRAAGAAKYGLGKDYMQNVFPVLASHTSGFGVKLATSNLALIGGRMTKRSKEALEEAGLWRDGHLLNETEYQNSPFDWVQHHVRPLLEGQGVHFGEEMSVDDKQKVSGFASKTFSAKNTADMVIASLLDAPLIDKYRRSSGKDIDSVDKLAPKDAGIAWSAVTKQLGDLGTAASNTSLAIGAMDSAATALANMTHFLQTGEVPPDSRGGRLLNWWRGGGDKADPDTSIWRTGSGGYYGEPNFAGSIAPDKGPSWTQGWAGWGPERDEHGNRLTKPGALDKYIWSDPKLGTYPEVTPTMTYGTGVGGDKSVRDVNVSGNVSGEAKVTFIAGSSLIDVVNRAEAAIKLAGELHSGNGPGSLGESAPDAAAPSPRPGPAPRPTE